MGQHRIRLQGAPMVARHQPQAQHGIVDHIIHAFGRTPVFRIQRRQRQILQPAGADASTGQATVASEASKAAAAARSSCGSNPMASNRSSPNSLIMEEVM